MQVKSEDFKKLKLNVDEVPEGWSLFKQFPELNRYPEFKSMELPKGWDREKIIRYIVYAYDKESPIVKGEKSLPARKRMAAERAGFEVLKDGDYDDNVKSIFALKNQCINRMITRYVRSVVGDYRYSLLISGLETYFGNINTLTTDSEAKDKTKLFNETNKLAEQLETLTDQIFSQDTGMFNVVDELMEEENNSITSWPEHWASLREQA